MKFYYKRTKKIVKQFVWKNFKPELHFLHIGKTGGTIVKNTLKPYTYLRNYYLLIHSHDVRVSDIPEGCKFMFFLRDPLSRFISGFNFRLRKGQPLVYHEWSNEERSAFSKFKTPNDLALALTDQNEEIKQHAINAMESIEHVSNHYDYWFHSIEYMKQRERDIFFIGFQESLESDFKLLTNLLNLDAKVELLRDPVLSLKAPSNQQKELDKVARENVKNWYYDDYQLYNYFKDLRTRTQ